ncbi:MAG: UvrABC system protein [Candidatus Kaiserbacteria bacterium]|nr:UvrABC system protein [Candidatus Kaiserbacteria bacterium]
MTREDLNKVKLPDAPGVYVFRDAKKKVLYIGKATSLRDRVRSYFTSDLLATRSPLIAQMVEKASSISYTETNSVLEALILEASLIKQHQPPANTDQKDNKSFNYLAITKEAFPRVIIVRGRVLFDAVHPVPYTTKYVFGPFPHGGQLKEALAIVRKIFPFHDTCTPCAATLAEEPTVHLDESPKKRTANKQCRPCFNRQLGLCPGVCSGEISQEEYKEVIRNIAELFSGKFKGLQQRLAREMKKASKEERFEEARTLQRQVAALTHVRDVSLIKSDLASDGGSSRVRIEAYDVAHTGGSETLGVMVVVQAGEAIKSAYRMFKIRTSTNDDVASLSEMIVRRLSHREWPLPQIIAVDGSTAQVRVAEHSLQNAGLSIPVVGVVKDARHRPDHLIGDDASIKQFEKDILLANAESHRFAITKHRKRMRRALF